MQLKSLLSIVVLAVMTWGMNTWEVSPACRCHEARDLAQIAISGWLSCRARPRCGSLMAAERRLVVLGDRLVVLVVNEH